MRNTEAVGSLSGIVGPSLVLRCYWLFGPPPSRGRAGNNQKTPNRRGVNSDKANYRWGDCPHEAPKGKRHKKG
jgi:hypothetical protein